eukprot:scaffold152106_cov38-Prasinocladus_malaysianus.AAC.1
MYGQVLSDPRMRRANAKKYGPSSRGTGGGGSNESTMHGNNKGKSSGGYQMNGLRVELTCPGWCDSAAASSADAEMKPVPYMDKKFRNLSNPSSMEKLPQIGASL